MSDLESALHYSLRVELSGHISISGDDLLALKKYINVLAKVSHIIHTHIKYPLEFFSLVSSQNKPLEGDTLNFSIQDVVYFQALA